MNFGESCCGFQVYWPLEENEEEEGAWSDSPSTEIIQLVNGLIDLKYEFNREEGKLWNLTIRTVNYIQEIKRVSSTSTSM